MSINDLPTIEHISLSYNERGRIVVQAEEGWVFYRLDMYPEGTPEEEICYVSYGVYAPTFNFDLLVVVDATTVPENQIFGGGNNTEIM